MIQDSDSSTYKVLHPMQKKLYIPSLIFGVIAIIGIIIMPWMGEVGMANPKTADTLGLWVNFLGKFHPLFLHLPIGAVMLVFVMQGAKLLSLGKYKPNTTMALFFAAATSLFAVVFGYCLYLTGAFEGDLIEEHKRDGIIFTVLVIIAFLVKYTADLKPANPFFSPLYGILLLATGAVMMSAGHHGGKITHGDPLDALPSKILDQREAETNKPVDADPLVYSGIVHNILEEKCISCHGKKKKKSGLRLDSYAYMLEGGEEEECLVPGDLEKSALISYLHLPMEDDLHMPPEGKTQLTKEEILILEWWVKIGAPEKSRLSEVEVTPAIQTALATLTGDETEDTQSNEVELSDGNISNEQPSLSDDMSLLRKIRSNLPHATAYKIERYFGNDVDIESIQNAFRQLGPPSLLHAEDHGGCDQEHDHAHFTLFSLWSAEFTSLIHACFNTLRIWISGHKPNEQSENRHELQTAPRWFAVLSLFIVPVLLVPCLYFIHRMISQVCDLARGWYHTFIANNNDKPKLKPWVAWIITLGLGIPILLLPIVCTPNFLHTMPVESKEREPYPYSKAISRFLVLFAALGTGFIAVTAIIASPLGVSIGLWVWLFFVAGFLSEWQTLELSMYDLLHKVFKHKNPWLRHELESKIAKKLNKEWGVPQEKWLTFDEWSKLSPGIEDQARHLLHMQMGAMAVSVVIGIGVFALAFTHTAYALPILFGAAVCSAHPAIIIALLALIATGTAVAWFCLVYRGLREVIYNPYGDHLVGVWIKTLHKLFRENTAESKHWANKLKLPFMGLFVFGMTFLVVFYLMTAGPAWCQAANKLYKNPAFAFILDCFYYPFMFLFYSNAGKKTCDAMITLGVNLKTGILAIASASFKAYKAAMDQCDYKVTKGLLGILWLVETLLKTLCFLLLDFSLTLGLFFLHLIGDAAIGSEEAAPRGFSANAVLVINSLQHLFADFGFILEWSSGGLDHEHSHDGVKVAPYKVSLVYGLASMTLIIPLCHLALHKFAPQRFSHPIHWLMPNNREVDSDHNASNKITAALTPLPNATNTLPDNTSDDNLPRPLAGMTQSNPEVDDNGNKARAKQRKNWVNFGHFGPKFEVDLDGLSCVFTEI